jgi:hypothetical protein
MPYRRLPNTDSARLKAFHAALEKGADLPPFKLAFSQGTLAKIQSLLPQYNQALYEHRNYYDQLLEKSRDYQKYLRKARLYISHFIQVVNMAIQRGELPSNTRSYFNMDKDEKKLPLLQTDQDVIDWGKKIIEGEKVRRMEGLTAITNPTIAVVKVHCDKFDEVHNNHIILKKRHQKAQDNLIEKRDVADQLIQQLWNEVENTFRELPEDLKRKKSSEYGVVYVYRKNEIPQPDFYKPQNMEIIQEQVFSSQNIS